MTTEIRRPRGLTSRSGSRAEFPDTMSRNHTTGPPSIQIGAAISS